MLHSVSDDGIVVVNEREGPGYGGSKVDVRRRLFQDSLDAHVHAHDLGEMWLAPLDVVLDEKRALIVQPDLFFISHNRAWIVKDRVRGAPDLVIEVLSPEPRIGRTDERVRWFAEHGVRECWLVHQDERSIAVIEFVRRRVAARHVYRRHDPMKSVVLPDFVLRVDDILMA